MNRFLQSVLRDVIVPRELRGKITLWQSLSHNRWPILFQAKTKVEVLVEQQGAESSPLCTEVSDSQGAGHFKVIVEAVATFAAWGLKVFQVRFWIDSHTKRIFFFIA